MEERQLEQHVKILGWLHIAGSALFVVIALFVFVLLGGIGAASGDPEAAPILSLIGVLVCGFLFLLAVPGLAAGYGLLQRQNWGRILAIIVGALNLMNFPLGTALAVYTFWVLFQESATSYFTGGGDKGGKVEAA